MANTYDVGDGVRVTGTFTVSDVNTDPTSVTLKVTDPSGNVGTQSTTKSGTGVYYADLVLDEPGTYYYQWVGTGAVVAATEPHFFVRKRRADE